MPSLYLWRIVLLALENQQEEINMKAKRVEKNSSYANGVRKCTVELALELLQVGMFA